MTTGPLTVKYLERDSQWLVQDAHCASIAWFFEEADARAFVALPELEKLVTEWREMAKMALAVGAVPGDYGYEARWAAVEICADELAAALAQADGPAPKE